MNMLDKVRGCFLGIAIGDALGKPTESMSAELIAEKFGRITDYFQNPHHKYFDGEPAGSWTDDTQLTLAVARSFFASGTFDLDAIAEEHCAEFMKTVAGWGSTTREAVARMVDGVHWSEASMTDKAGRGFGNGVAMKAAPIGLYMAITNPYCDNPQWSDDVKKLVKFATMTHFSSIGIASGMTQAVAIQKCFNSDPKDFDVSSFCRSLIGAGKMSNKYLFKSGESDNLATRLDLLNKREEYDTPRIISELKGSCYIYESLPFSYMFFVRNPLSIDCMYDCASSGGDTDTNASMVGGLLGALHGTSIFPEHLVEGLRDREEVMRIADKFYSKVKDR